MGNCLFCDQAADPSQVPGGAIYEDELLYATQAYDGEEPVYLGNLRIVTKRHVPTLADLTDDEARALGLLVARLGRALVACVGAERIYAHTFSEAIHHLHVYVTARYPGVPEAYWRWAVTDRPDAPRGGTAEVAALSERLRAYLNESGLSSGEAGMSSELISPQDLNEWQSPDLTPVVIDVREPDEYAAGHVAGALNVPLGMLPDQLPEWARTRLIVTYCNMYHRGTSRSERAAALLREHGLAARTLDGGYRAWKAAGLRVEEPAPQP